MDRHRWRFYETTNGRQPVRDFINDLSDEDAAEVVAALKDVARKGTAAAQHVRGDLYEVKADGRNRTYRILFAPEGKHDQVLLALQGLVKKTQRLPHDTIGVAEDRLVEWRMRGEERRRRTRPDRQ